MTVSPNDVIERVEAVCEPYGIGEWGKVLKADLRELIRLARAGASRQDEVERVVELFTAFCRGQETRSLCRWSKADSDHSIEVFRQEALKAIGGGSGYDHD